ncbi:MAG: lipopolysaccharide heptosyltransferase II [Blastocatellia bacterium]|nr:lipopolysaccharide heptosyltransferase II [Blastocatellia bacterium]
MGRKEPTATCLLLLPTEMNIVVRGTNWIGDAIMTIPALRELRRIFPDAGIVLHTRSWAESIFRDAVFIDEIVTFEKAGSPFKNVSVQSRVLSEFGFDLAVLLPNSFESALTASLARIPRRIGYNKDLRGLLLTDPLPVPEWKEKRHEVYYYINLIAEIEKRFLGTDSVLHSELDSRLEISEERKANARKMLSEAGVDTSRKTIALGVGSANSRAKRWGTENYAALNDRFQAELDANVVLIGSKDEADVSNEVFEFARIKPIILTGKTDMAEAAAILSVIDMLVANDMGLAHLAPAVGTQTAVIFGPTNPVTTRPFSANATVIRKDVECSPCMLRDCPIDHRCMTRISVADVFNICEETLAVDQNEK